MSSNGVPTGSKELWRHSSPQDTQIYDFMMKLNAEHNLSLKSYNDLWRWSISKPALFWERIWHYTAIKSHKPYDRVSICRSRAMAPWHLPGRGYLTAKSLLLLTSITGPRI